MSVWYSVPDDLHSTPGVMHVYSRCYTRITLGVVKGWEQHVPWYHVIYGCVAYDMHMYVIYFSQLYVMLLVSCESTYFYSARHSKLMYLVSIGSTLASGTQSLLTGAQLQPSCSRLSVLS